MRLRRTLTGLGFLLALVFACEEDGGPVSDMAPPGRVLDLVVTDVTQSTITLTWTAPGDDGDTGRATHYGLRRSGAAITDGNFFMATSVSGVPAPQIAGTAETFTVTGLDSTLTYFFAIRSRDESGNNSLVSVNARWPTHLRADIEPARDNTIYEEGDSSNGIGEYIFAGENANGSAPPPDARRALLYFAIADSLPAGAIIDSVQLTLHLSKTIAPVKTVTLHTLTAGWGEGNSDADFDEGTGIGAQPGDATWTHRFFDTTNWTTPGGDFVATAVASRAVLSAGFYPWKSAAMAADVQSWLDSPATNFGWILIGDETTAITAKRFDSRENAVVARRPSLTIYYTLLP